MTGESVGPEAVTGFFGLLEKLQDPILGILIIAVFGLYWLGRKDKQEDQKRYDALVKQLQDDQKEQFAIHMAESRASTQSTNDLKNTLGTQGALTSQILSDIKADVSAMRNKNG